MGVFSKFFSKKSKETIQEIELDLLKLKKKTNAEMIAIFGISGRLKGLPLIYASDDDTDLKKFTARLYELLAPIAFLSDNKTFRDFVINYEDSILFYKEILTNIGYFAIIRDKDGVLPLKQWVNKNETVLKDLLHN